MRVNDQQCRLESDFISKFVSLFVYLFVCSTNDKDHNHNHELLSKDDSCLNRHGHCPRHWCHRSGGSHR